ncbi:MAG: hypothetical protein AAF612_04990 [Planctomycetota bacterium]
MIWLEILVFCVTLYLLIVPFAMGLLVLGSVCRVRFVPKDAAEDRELLEELQLDTEELASWGFAYLGSYAEKSLAAESDIALWKQPNDPAFLMAAMVAGAKEPQIAFVSVLSWESGVSVSTGTAKSGHLPPLPKRAYLQTFEGADLGTLWRRHQEAEVAVVEGLRLEVQPYEVDVVRLLTHVYAELGKHFALKPWLWPVFVWRYWIGQHLRHNKTVAELM